MLAYFLRLLLVVSPILLWQAVELFVLPSNFFTFRPWEAVTVQNSGLFRGPFYPRQDISMRAAGDLDPRGPRLKQVRFRTDSYGYRNPEDYVSSPRYDFLLVGCSNFAGANVDDDRTLRAVLERDYHKRVYTYASYYPNTNSFTNDVRVKRNPPRFVVLDIRPQDVIHGRYVDWPVDPPINESQKALLDEPCQLWERAVFSGTSDEFRILIDRAGKQLAYNWFRARAMLAKRKQEPPLTIDEARRNFGLVLESMVRLRETLRKQDCELIVLLMPLLFPEGVGDVFAAELEKHVPMVHWQATSPYRDEIDPRQWSEPNDSHWRESSILCAARRIAGVSEGL